MRTVARSGAMAVAGVLAVTLASQVAPAQEPDISYSPVTDERLREGDPSDWLMYRRTLRQSRLQPARADHDRERGGPRAGLDHVDRRDVRSRGAADRQRRRDVRDDAGGPGHRHRCAHRRATLDLQPAVPGGHGAPASDEPRRRPVRRQGLLYDTRRVRGGPRRGVRRGGLGDGGRRLPDRLLHDDRAAGGERQGAGRTLGRRAGHPRVRGRVRSRHRRGGVAHAHDPATGRAGERDLAGRDVAHRRRLDLDHRLVRSGAEPDLLGHGQPGTLDRRPASGRQPLHELGRRLRRRHR